MCIPWFKKQNSIQDIQGKVLLLPSTTALLQETIFAHFIKISF